MSAPEARTEAAGMAIRQIGDAPLATRVSGLSPDLVEVLAKTVCSKLSPDQLLLYLAICGQKRVDPFTQAYAFPNSDGGLAFGLRIDGMRALAMRTGEYESRKIETLWSNPDGTGTMIGARATVRRKGMTEPVVEEAWMAEYDRGGMGWKQFPETMIRKVAESKALRAAFPDALSGVYEPAELSE
jgi:RecT family